MFMQCDLLLFIQYKTDISRQNDLCSYDRHDEVHDNEYGIEKSRGHQLVCLVIQRIRNSIEKEEKQEDTHQADHKLFGSVECILHSEFEVEIYHCQQKEDIYEF
jgi:hypothetical protein